VEQDLPGSGAGEVAQTMYTHISKCKNNKMRKKNVNITFVISHLQM
jgi:hypothetical protein